MSEWIWIAECVEETGIRADDLIESFARCGVPVKRMHPNGNTTGLTFPHAQRAAYERWKGLAAWMPETRYRVTALPISPPA